MGSDLWFSRRTFLQGAGAFSVANLAMWMGGCESCWQQIQNRPTRRNIANLPANDPIIQAYQAAVTAMKALPPSDPRSWSAQAQIHFDHCPHQNWWWLPWHRAFLSYFERICRKLSGHDDFALPYWNWTTSPSVPAPFWGNGNPLFDPTRAIGPSDTADPSWVSASVIEGILELTNFYDFASYPATTQRQRTTFGMLESTPHNNIHPWVGGDMYGFHSPLDPVFWCHHNILDCLWNEWNINRGNPNTNDPNWWNLHFTEFVDENGAAVDIAAGLTVLFPIFDYQFEPCGPAHTGAGDMNKSAMSKADLEKFLRAGAPVKFEIAQHFELQRAVASEVGRPMRSIAKIEDQVLRGALESADKAVMLTVDGVEIPEKTDYFVRVFLGKPDASPDTPITDAHYGGSFGFFHDAAPMKDMPAHEKFGYLVDVTSTLRHLNQSGSLTSGRLDVTLVPVVYEHRQAEGQKLAIEKLEVSIAQIR
jgi:tyrosinase